MSDEEEKKGLRLASFNPLVKKGEHAYEPVTLSIAYTKTAPLIQEEAIKPPQTSPEYMPPEELETQKQNLVSNLISRLKIKSLTPFGKLKVKEILEKEINFNDPDWQKDIQDYFNVTDDIESAIGMIRDYGKHYFKSGNIPPSVYTTALAIEFSDNAPKLPYAEKKIYKNVATLLQTYGQNFANEKPQSQAVFLNHLKNRIDEDLNIYLGKDGEDHYEELERKYLHFYAPIAANLSNNTPFEQKIKEYIAEIEQALSIESAPKAEYIKFSEYKRNPESAATNRVFPPTRDIIAQTQIKPDPSRNHILFSHPPEELIP